jgi:hypothetical protein
MTDKFEIQEKARLAHEKAESKLRDILSDPPITWNGSEGAKLSYINQQAKLVTEIQAKLRREKKFLNAMKAYFTTWQALEAADKNLDDHIRNL